MQVQGIYSRWPTEGAVYLEEQGAVPAQRLSEDTNSALLATEAEVESSNMELRPTKNPNIHTQGAGKDRASSWLDCSLGIRKKTVFLHREAVQEKE